MRNVYTQIEQNTYTEIHMTHSWVCTYTHTHHTQR